MHDLNKITIFVASITINPNYFLKTIIHHEENRYTSFRNRGFRRICRI